MIYAPQQYFVRETVEQGRRCHSRFVLAQRSQLLLMLVADPYSWRVPQLTASLVTNLSSSRLTKALCQASRADPRPLKHSRPVNVNEEECAALMQNSVTQLQKFEITSEVRLGVVCAETSPRASDPPDSLSQSSPLFSHSTVVHLT
jgi:hypothetical protein